jgi:hypothetical protein
MPLHELEREVRWVRQVVTQTVTAAWREGDNALVETELETTVRPLYRELDDGGASTQAGPLLVATSAGTFTDG